MGGGGDDAEQMSAAPERGDFPICYKQLQGPTTLGKKRKRKKKKEKKKRTL